MGYKWGKFQGTVCLVLGCAILLAAGYLAWAAGIKRVGLAWLGGSILCATGIGLVTKRRFGVVLACVMFVATLLSPIAGTRRRYFFTAIGLGFWGVPALVYYPKRWKSLR
jgi:hypothetical protein